MLVFWMVKVSEEFFLGPEAIELKCEEMGQYIYAEGYGKSERNEIAKLCQNINFSGIF